MRRTLRREKRGRTRNPFTKKSFQTGSGMFGELSREQFNIVVVGGFSESGVVELDRLNLIAEIFGATVNIVLG